MWRMRPQKTWTFMLVLQDSRNINRPCIFLVNVRWYSRTTDRGEGFAMSCLGDSFLQKEGSGKRRIEKLMVVSPSFPSMSASKPFDVIRSEAICCNFSPIYTAPPSRQNKGREIKALEGFSSLLFLCFCHSIWLLFFFLTAQELSPCIASRGSLAISDQKKKKIVGEKSHIRDRWKKCWHQL